jgi:hypothetical protein
MAAMTPDRFTALALANPVNAAILARLPALGLPQAHLVAGCLFQAVWNHRAGRPPGDAVKDYDVFYFDEDLSWEAEDRAIRAAAALFQDLGVEVELRNQARVHLWYPGRFGAPYPRLRSARDGIDRYLVACTCVGLPADGGAPYLPDSLDDLWHGRLRINPRHPERRQFAAKADSYRARWDWLSVEG